MERVFRQSLAVAPVGFCAVFTTHMIASWEHRVVTLARFLDWFLTYARTSMVASRRPKIQAPPGRLAWLPKPVPGCGPRAMWCEAAGVHAPAVPGIVVVFVVVAGRPLPGLGVGAAISTSVAGVVGCGHGNGSV